MSMKNGKACIKCGVSEWTSAGACKPCKRRRDTRWQQDNAESEAARAAVYRNKNPEKHRAAVDRWHAANPEKRKAIRNDWASRNRDKQKTYNANNKAQRKRRTIKLTPEQKQELYRIYRECPKGYHVDHVIPLQGKLVSGLHVPWNLQYLTIAENCSKRNNYDPN